MKKQIPLFFFLLWLPGAAGLFAQDSDFSNCSAAFLAKKMIVDDYSPEGKCRIPADAAGMLTVHPVTLESGKEPIPGEKIKFKVGIRSKSGNTLMLLWEDTYEEIDIRTVLKECKKGDHIVLITLEREWALPHSEILIE